MDLDGAIGVLKKVNEANPFGYIGFYHDEKIQVRSKDFPEISKGFDVQIKRFDYKTEEYFFEYKGVIFFTLIEESADNE